MRKKSKYRPRGVIRDPIAYAIKGVQRVASLPEGTDLMIKNHSALESIRTGAADRGDLDVLISALNITEALAMLRIGEEWRSEIRAAQDALYAVGSRGAETGKFILRGPELTALNVGMEIHDAQLQACTVSELERAMSIVTNTIRSKKARAIVQRKESI